MEGAVQTQGHGNGVEVAVRIWLLLAAVVRLGFSFLLAAIALYVFVVLAFNVSGGTTQKFDQAVVEYFQTHQPDWMRIPVTWLTRLADGPVVIAVTLVTALILCLRQSWGAALGAAVTSLGGFALVEGLKIVFARDRPHSLVEVTGHSFPSGHSFFSLALYGFIAYQLAREAPVKYKRLGWSIVILIALLVGSSRVLLGVHYPTDVLAGFMAAGFWLWACLRIPRFARRRSWREWREDRTGALKSAVAELDEARRNGVVDRAPSKKPPVSGAILLWLADGFAALYRIVAKWSGVLRASQIDTAIRTLALANADPQTVDPTTLSAAKTLLLLPTESSEAPP